MNGESTYYQYDTGGNIVLETYKDEQEQIQIKVKYIRDTAGKALAQEQNNNTYYYLYNAHGDITGLTDSSGNEVASYTYDEFGNLINSTGSIYNPLRYSGANNGYFDEETGLYKMGVRYYDSSTGRWIMRDSLEGVQELPDTKNKYTYVRNNPIGRIDPSGQWDADKFHFAKTRFIAEDMGWGKGGARILAEADRAMDYEWGKAVQYFGVGFHFEIGRFPGTLTSTVQRNLKRAVALRKQGQLVRANQWLGGGLHSLQDYYAHPRGLLGVAAHGFDSVLVLTNRIARFMANSWAVRTLTPGRRISIRKYEGTYDDPGRNKNGYKWALRKTRDYLVRYWYYYDSAANLF